MSDKHHNWAVGLDPPKIRPHSLAKHRLLRSYLEAYVSVLTANLRQDRFRLTLVDGFAGGGIYLDPLTNTQKPGSPLLMLEAMDAAQSAAQARRTKPFFLDVEYIFIEKEGPYFNHLESVLKASRFSKLLGEKIHLIQQEFVPSVEKVVLHAKRRSRKGRTIFFLDQFGYIDVPLPTIRGLLSSLPFAEIILTFATDFLIDYMGNNSQTELILEKLGLHELFDLVSSPKESIQWRRVIQYALHQQIPLKTGARHYSPFFITSTDSHRDFWLIHLSNHAKAKDVMIELHWKENKSFSHYGGSGFNMLGYNETLDESITKQRLLPGGFHFDEAAKQSARLSLLEQLPAWLRLHREPISFQLLFSLVTNDCPATSSMLSEILKELAEQNIIEIKDSTGFVKRRNGIQSVDDVILLCPQKLLFLPPWI